MIVPATSARPIPGAARRILFLLVLLLAAVSAPLARSSAQDGSLARGGVQVIAQGLTAPPAGNVTWRVVRHQLPVQADARPSNRLPAAVGFLLADSGSVFISDQQTKQRFRLAPGEAEFVATGANQTWASLAEEPASAFTIELIDRELVDSAEAGEVLFAGGGFEMPVGDYDLDLLSGSVRQGDRARIAEGEYPTVVFATSGTIRITSTRADEPVILERGQGVMLRGDLAIDGGRERSSTFVAGAVGGAVTGGIAGTPVPTATPSPTAEPEETPEPTESRDQDEERTPTPEPDDEPRATPEGASVRIAVRLCREGMTQANLNPRGCQRADGNYRLALVRPDGERLRLNDADRVTPHFVRWSGLEPGVYQLIVGDLPRGYITYSLDGFPCCPIANGWPITITANIIYEGTLYLLQDANPVAAGGPARETVRTNSPPSELSGDSDGDGLTDALELSYWGTSPQSIDSDGDTIPDGVEAYGSNGYRTKPSQWDSDGDGMADNIEIEQGSSPTG